MKITKDIIFSTFNKDCASYYYSTGNCARENQKCSLSICPMVKTRVEKIKRSNKKAARRIEKVSRRESHGSHHLDQEGH